MTVITPVIRRAVVALAVLLAGCAMTVPRDALQLPQDAAARREQQTRRFDGISEQRMLAASTGVLQDLGFTIDEVEARIGLVVGSKQRSAVNEVEVAAAYLLTTLSVLALAPTAPEYAKRQVVRVAVVTAPATDAGATSTLVRVTLQRAVFDNHDRVRRVEEVAGEDLYQEFFERLSQSAFLEAQSP